MKILNGVKTFNINVIVYIQRETYKYSAAVDCYIII